MKMKTEQYSAGIKVNGKSPAKRWIRGLFGFLIILSGISVPGSSYGPPIPVCPDCALPREPNTTNVYVKSPVVVNRGTVIQKIVFPGAEIRQDFAVQAGRTYYVYLLPHSGNPDLGVSATVIRPFVMPDWQWMPNPGSSFEGTVITPAVSGVYSTKVRGTGPKSSSYSLAIFER